MQRMRSLATLFQDRLLTRWRPRGWRRASALFGLLVCLLLCGFTFQELPAPESSATNAVTNMLSANSRRAYAEVMKLRRGPARELLRPELANAPTAPGPLLVANSADFAELIVSQDASRYEALVAAQEAHLEALERAPASALRDYARAEITLHLGLSQLLFRHLVMGGLHLRRGYGLMQSRGEAVPAFLPARKTLGICQFAVGSLPEGYHWLLSLLGLSADSGTGLRNLALAAAQPHDFQLKAKST